MSFINTLSVLYLISYCLLGYKNPNRVKLFKKKKEKTKWIVTRDLFFQIVITSFFIKNSINYGLLEILQFITISLLILRLMKANEDIFFKKYKYEKILAKFFYNKKDEINNINKLKNQARFMLKKINKNNLVGESYVLQDVCLPNKIDPLSDNVFFSDYIILSSFGVFVLNFQETTGELYSKKGLFSGDWLKTIAEENKIEDYKNPFKDNYMYVKNLKMILNKG
ncbi:MAG: NERD domain-containing protein, partial [archaeon]